MEPAELATRYDSLRSSLEKLHDYARDRLGAELKPLKPVVVEPRIKSLATIYQKLQTGQFESLLALDDLVGVKIVMLRRSEINAAARVVREAFQVVHEKARVIDPTTFRYREPHLVVLPPADFLERNTDLDGLKVEVQLTTAVQHALDMVTHSFDYKGSTLEWAKFRLVAQLRATLELVDNILDNMQSSAQLVEESVVLPGGLLEQVALLDVIAARFTDDHLPKDRRRMAETIARWSSAAGLNPVELDELLSRHPDLLAATSLTPLDAILGALFRERASALLSQHDLRFAVSDELRTACPETADIPGDRLVALS